MAFRQGDLVLIPVPFSDLSAQKKRPVVIVSGNHFNETQDDLIVVAVTSNPAMTPYTLTLSDSDLVQGHLPRVSQIRTDKIYTSVTIHCCAACGPCSRPHANQN